MNSFQILTYPNSQFTKLCPFWLAPVCYLLILVGQKWVRRKFPQDPLNIQEVYFMENDFVHMCWNLWHSFDLCVNENSRSRQLKDFSIVGYLLCIIQNRNDQTRGHYTGLQVKYRCLSYSQKLSKFQYF